MKVPTLSSSLCFGSPPGVCAFRNSIAYAAASSGSSVTTLSVLRYVCTGPCKWLRIISLLACEFSFNGVKQQRSDMYNGSCMRAASPGCVRG